MLFMLSIESRDFENSISRVDFDCSKFVFIRTQFMNFRFNFSISQALLSSKHSRTLFRNPRHGKQPGAAFRLVSFCYQLEWISDVFSWARQREKKTCAIFFHAWQLRGYHGILGKNEFLMTRKKFLRIQRQ